MSTTLESTRTSPESLPAVSIPWKTRLFLAALAGLRLLRPGARLERLEAYIRSTLTPSAVQAAHERQKPLGGYYPGLSAKPWYAAGDHPVLERTAAVLEGGAATILEELRARLADRGAIARYEASHRYSSLLGNAWGGIALWKGGELTEESRRFPATAAMIRELQPDLLPFGEVVFLFLQPGVHLPAHHDVTNAQITCHLGLMVPQDCALRVDQEVRSWEVGKALFFDHTFEHEAWNRSEEIRAILVVNLLRPDLGAAEKRLLKLFYRGGFHRA